ncbi:DUF4956 domain-containing protein [Candidatus Uabimicrobium amorphum]|uniref:DUF4956 domain-containing protein n=1 Tax=Uabimicrobium amorphum TaxID=2596890 RepID=A0A5S9INW5_UABAM|nr:DUF4956 domain-containing protein [Candidatus Uabimicrobium amorphum]BBM84896.1 DUF4956 domain-containing protein [Candidatus Uabimicrobium amorphum]
MPPELTAVDFKDPLDLKYLLINLAIGVILSLILSFHFKRFGSTLSNRNELSQVFPFILLTTILIISVVKSSLALSLGLVGALSIVRFRTPIKEPEELAYLFMAIAMGLGLGAHQGLPTIISSILILGVMAFIKTYRKDLKGKSMFLSVDWNSSEYPDNSLNSLNEIISKHSSSCDLRRFDIRQDLLEAVYFVDFVSDKNLSEITEELRQTYPKIGITFLDQSQLPSV